MFAGYFWPKSLLNKQKKPVLRPEIAQIWGMREINYIWREFNLADGGKNKFWRGLNSADFGQIRQIRQIFFPPKFLPL